MIIDRHHELRKLRDSLTAAYQGLAQARAAYEAIMTDSDIRQDLMDEEQISAELRQMVTGWFAQDGPITTLLADMQTETAAPLSGYTPPIVY
jgi:hypothetical protein